MNLSVLDNLHYVINRLVFDALDDVLVWTEHEWFRFEITDALRHGFYGRKLTYTIGGAIGIFHPDNASFFDLADTLASCDP